MQRGIAGVVVLPTEHSCKGVLAYWKDLLTRVFCLVG